MSFGPPQPDELPGYVKRTLPLPEEDDGPLSATLICLEGSLARQFAKGTVLYLHGFVDYFFQTHLCEAFETAGYRFFALDLRRYGRSLNAQNRPNYARHIDEYFEEISEALRLLSSDGKVSLVAHSTGGLIAAHYASRGSERARIHRLVLNSPFLRFPAKGLLKLKLHAAHLLGRALPTVRLPQELSPVYGMTLHASEQGEFHYDLAKKPLRGFPFYGGWLDMILEAQKQAAVGLDLSLPVLVLHSMRSTISGRAPTPADFRADCVLSVTDIAQLAPRLGSQVTVEAIEDGLHDLFLSPSAVRHQAITRVLDFLA